MTETNTLENILTDVTKHIDMETSSVDDSEDNSVYVDCSHITKQQNIKLILYDFDQTITTVHLYKELKGKDIDLDMSNERLIEIFGGNERLTKLQKHFQVLVDK